MGKVYNGGFTASTGFKRTDTSPLDDSDIVQSLIDLTNGSIDKPYPMMIVGVIDNVSHYKLIALPATDPANWINITSAGTTDATTLQGLAPSDTADSDAHVIATDASGIARILALVTTLIETNSFALIKAQESTAPVSTDTVTMGINAGSNRFTFKNVPLALFKDYLAIGGLDATTLGGLSLALVGSTPNSIPYRDANGLLFATGIGINGAFAQVNVLRGDATVSPITKAEIDVLGINAGFLSGRILDSNPVANRIPLRDPSDGALKAALFKLTSWDLKQIAGTLVFRSDSLGFQAQFPTTKSGTVAYTVDIPDNTDYVDLTTAQTISGPKSFSDDVNIQGVAPTLIFSDTGSVTNKIIQYLGASSTFVISEKVYVQGQVLTESFKVTNLNTAPTSATDTGTTGEIRYTADFIYVCVGTNQWRRTPLTTW